MGTLLQNVVNFVFLLLAITLLIVLWGSATDNTNTNNLLEQIETVRDENRKVIGSNTAFLEQKINSLAKVQNDYQYSTSRKIALLENKVESLSKTERQHRLISNNLNKSLIINTDVAVKRTESASE